MKEVVVFGIFDGVHDGHRDLFRQAKELGDELTVVVGRDEIAEKLKGKKPKYAEAERVKLVEAEPLVNRAVLGDQQLSTYSVLVQLNPDVICLGYDQAELEEDLRRWVGQKDVEIHRAKAHNKDTLHNSLLK